MFFKTKTYQINFNGIDIKAKENKTILFSLLKGRADVKYSCGIGECKQCRFQLISGEVDMEGSELLACKCYPITDITLSQY